MFFISLVMEIIELAIAGTAIMYLYQDYKRDFIGVKTLWQNGSHRAMRLLGTKENASERSKQLIERWAKSVGELREAVALLEANLEQSSRRAQEEEVLAIDFERLAEQALREQKEATAASAIASKSNHIKSAALFHENAKRLRETAKKLRIQLLVVEAEFEAKQSDAEYIQLSEMLAQVNRKLYTLISNVAADTGLTDRGELKQLLLDTEVEKLQAEKLLKMAEEHGENQLHAFLRDDEIRKGIEDIRKRISLPYPTENQVIEVIEPELMIEGNGKG